MPGKIFVNYRRDDVPGDARGVRDGLAAKFGKSNVFMDVDNLLVGQRFDVELAKALDACDVLIAIIGPRWTEQLRQRMASGERDYVREEIAAALSRRIVVIPVRVGRDGAMPTFPRPDELPEEIRDLVLHQKLDVAHERFGRDMAELIDGIVAVRRATGSAARPGGIVPWRWIGATAATVALVAWVGAYQAGLPVWWPFAPGKQAATLDPTQADLAAAAGRAVEAEQKTQAEARRKRDEDDARARREAEAAEAKRKADAAERQRLAELEAKRKADEEARRVPQPGQTFRDCNDGCPEMVVVPAGRFRMGEGGSARDVTIQQAFAVGKFEVTFAEWESCVAGGGCQSNRSPNDRGWGKGRRPVINVSWHDAKEYVGWLSRKTGQTYRLLSEAEWEYAARAGTTTKYFWGDDIGKGNANANCNGCGSQWDNKQTAPVGSFKANAFGLFDMHGNVWEWCEDAYDASSRFLCGGSWFNSPVGVSSDDRLRDSPDSRRNYFGFRVARVLSPA